jgi:hypothetical protein
MGKQLLSLFGEVSHVKEFQGVLLYANVTNEITHLTVGSLIQVGKKTVFKLRIVNLISVVSDLLVDGNLECGLVS